MDLRQRLLSELPISFVTGRQWGNGSVALLSEGDAARSFGFAWRFSLDPRRTSGLFLATLGSSLAW